jgi:hypothetical protein
MATRELQQLCLCMRFTPAVVFREIVCRKYLLQEIYWPGCIATNFVCCVRQLADHLSVHYSAIGIEVYQERSVKTHFKCFVKCLPVTKSLC